METEEMMENETVEIENAMDGIEELEKGGDSKKVVAVLALGTAVISGGIILYNKVIKPKTSNLKEKIVTKKEEILSKNKDEDIIHVDEDEIKVEDSSN